jgi:hypothetical protein
MPIKVVSSQAQVPSAVKKATPYVISKADKSKYFNAVGQLISSEFVKSSVLANKQVILECNGIITARYLRYIIEGETPSGAMFIKSAIMSDKKEKLSTGKYK